MNILFNKTNTVDGRWVNYKVVSKNNKSVIQTQFINTLQQCSRNTVDTFLTKLRACYYHYQPVL